MRGVGERGFNRGGIPIAHCSDNVVGRFRPYHGRAGFCRLQGIDHRRQHFVFDRDRFGRGLRCYPRCRDHRRDRLAGKAHDLVRQ